MNIRSAIFGLVSIRPSTINDVIKKLPYSEGSIYNIIEDMVKNGELIKEKTNGEYKLLIPNNYNSQKIKEIYIKSLSYGIDPEYILGDNIIEIWKLLDENHNVKSIMKNSNYSEKWIRGILKKLLFYNIIVYEKKKPIIVKKNENHIITMLLDSLLKEKISHEKILIPGEMKYEEIFTTPKEIEKKLYEKIEQSITIKNTGWFIKGDNKVTVFESVEKDLSPEGIFILKIRTPEGIEDICIKYIIYEKINFTKLFSLAQEIKMVNQIGCYLDIINDIKEGIIPARIIQLFLNNISEKKEIFLREEMKYGKNALLEKYEKKWNIDLYLDINSIQHGVRSL